VVFVHHDPVVVLAARVTAAARVLPVLADAAVAVRLGAAREARLLSLPLDDRLGRGRGLEVSGGLI
jgi:hypothetical protein